LRQWLGFIVLLSIIGLGLYWYFTGLGKEFNVSLSAVKGSVEYRESAGDDWKPIEALPLKLTPSFEVRTMNDSEAELSLEANGIIRMGNFTRLVLTANRGKIAWVQTDGNCHYQIKKNSDRKEFRVAISDGEISATGTAFEIKNQDKDTTVMALDGAIKADYKDRSSQEAKAGEKIVINPVGKRVVEITEEDLKENWTYANIEKDLQNGYSLTESVIAKSGISSTASASQDNESADQTKNEAVIATGEEKTEMKINLEVKNSQKGALLDWTDGGENWDSWKIIKGEQPNLSYPSDSYRTLSKETKSYLWEISGEKKTYYFRICSYNNENGCVAWSETKSVEAGGETAGAERESASADDANSSSSASNASSGSGSSSAQTGVSSGKTTRGKCENSGGHWYSANGNCQCPKGEVFSGGACKKK
jgi:hypothetical protein